MSRPEGAPPSYEDAMQGTNTYAMASAPLMSSPEKSMMPHSVPSPMPPVASVSPNVPGGPSVPFVPPALAPGVPPGHPGAMPSAHPGAMPPGHPGAMPPSHPGAMPSGPMTTYIMPPAPTTVYVTNAAVGPKPCSMVCPNCTKSIRSTTTVTHSSTAHIVCCLLCIFGCCCCSCIPYCMDGYKITKHECPSCKAYLGTYKP